MECKNHPGIQTEYICRKCGSPVCLQCTVGLNNDHYCKECLQILVEANSKVRPAYRKTGKSKLLTFFLSIIPGTGHMYLGLMNKGLTMMCLFFASLFLVIMFSDVPAMSWFPGFFIPTLSIVFVFYSIFDSIETADRINSGDARSDTMSLEFEAVWRKLWDKKKLIGYVLVIMGFVSICNMFLSVFEEIFMKIFGIEISFTSLFLALSFVAFGIYLIRKSRE